MSKKPVPATLYVVGRVIDYKQSRWDLVGIFSDERDADENCISERYFVGPIQLDVPFPHGATDWEGAYYPRVTE